MVPGQLALFFVFFLTGCFAGAPPPKEEFNENEKDAYYKWFGLTRGAFNKEELASKYRKVARQYHPDKNKAEGAEEIFYKISKAFDVLNDDEKRARYNRGGAKAVDDSAGGGHDHARYANDIFRKMFEDMFDMDDIFGGGGGGRGRGRGPSSQTELAVTLEDLFTGRTMFVEYSRVKLCKKCDGTGAHDPKEVKRCNKCKGMGSYVAIQQIAPGFIQQMQMRCDQCDGRGSTFGKACSTCRGQRVGREQEKIEVIVPPGAKDGEAFKFKGMADEDPNREAGDLIAIIRTREHPAFQRDGIHLYMNVELTIREALLGFKKEIEQLDGTTFEITRKEPTQNDFVERISGYGMPRREAKKRGDLFIKYRVILPSKITRDQSLLIEKAFPKSSSSGIGHEEL